MQSTNSVWKYFSL